MPIQNDQLRPTCRRWIPIHFSCALLIFLTGCAETPPAPVQDRSLKSRPSAHANSRKPATLSVADTTFTYQVVRGDTLYGIAFKQGVDYRDLAQWNHIPPPYRIYVGEQLKLKVPAETRVAKMTPAPAVPSTQHSAIVIDPPSRAPIPSSSTNVTPANKSESTATTSEAEKPVPSSTVKVTSAEAEQPAVVPKPHPESSATGVNKGEIHWHWPSDGALISSFTPGDQTRQGIDLAGHAGDAVLAAADGSVVYSGNGLIGYGELIIIKHNSSYLSAYGHNRKRLVQEGDAVKAGQPVAEMGASGTNRDMLHFEIRKNGKPVNPADYLPAR